MSNSSPAAAGGRRYRRPRHRQHPDAVSTQHRDPVADAVEVLDGLALSQLQDDPARIDPSPAGECQKLLGLEGIGFQRARGEVDRQVEPRVQRAGAGEDGVQARQVELDGVLRRLGRDEQGTRIREPGVRARSNEALVAQHPARSQAVDRLVHGRQQPVGRDPVHGSGELGHGPSIVRDAVPGGIEQGDVGAAVALPPVEGGARLVHSCLRSLASSGIADTPMVSENGATPSVPEPPLSAPARMCRRRWQPPLARSPPAGRRTRPRRSGTRAQTCAGCPG